MGTGSDYTAFFDHLGIPSLDFRFSGKSNSVFHYHSNYDSYYWMNKFGDPGFKKHLAIAQVWGVLAVRLANVKVLPFQAMEYATTLAKYVSKLSAQDKINLDIKPLKQSIERFKIAAKKLDNLNDELCRNTLNTPREDIAYLNSRLRGIESGFISKEGGLPGREWFKHIASQISFFEEVSF